MSYVSYSYPSHSPARRSFLRRPRCDDEALWPPCRRFRSRCHTADARSRSLSSLCDIPPPFYIEYYVTFSLLRVHVVACLGESRCTRLCKEIVCELRRAFPFPLPLSNFMIFSDLPIIFLSLRPNLSLRNPRKFLPERAFFSSIRLDHMIVRKICKYNMFLM